MTQDTQRKPVEPSPIVTALAKILNTVAFFRTKKAIRCGTPLYDYTREQLEHGKFLGPWTFNLHESLLAAIPTVVAIPIINRVLPVHQNSGMRAMWKALSEEGGTVFQYTKDAFFDVFKFIEPLRFPLALLIGAHLLAWAGLRWRRRSKDALLRNKYVYLYIDGAYGLVPQAMFVLGVTCAYVILKCCSKFASILVKAYKA